MKIYFSRFLFERKLITALRSQGLTFHAGQDLRGATVIDIGHLTVRIGDNGVSVMGTGVSERYKPIDFRIRPRLDAEVVGEIIGYVRDPSKRSQPLWRQLYALIRG